MSGNRFEPVIMPHPYPLAMGIETENGLTFDIYGRDNPCEIDDFRNHFYSTVVNDEDEFIAWHGFLRNGMRFYPGGTGESNSHGDSARANPEIVSPECLTPSQLVVHQLATELYFERVLEKFIINHAEGPLPEIITGARLQRRVVDSWRNSKGMHDNFDFSNFPRVDSLQELDILSGILTAHLLTRPFISGAGYVYPGIGYSFAQKNTTLQEIHGRANLSTMANIRDGNRLEIRCGDVNISPWATWMRVGASALILAMASTPIYKKRFPKIIESVGGVNHKNICDVGTEYSLFDHMHETNAVDVQERLATLALDELQIYSDLPEEYRVLAREWLSYVDDYRRVLKGEATYHELMDRSDWARKLARIDRGIEKDRSRGNNRDHGDMASAAQDLHYDAVRYDVERDGSSTARLGYGYRLRSLDRFEVATEHEVEKATTQPPDTRARLRSEMLGHVNSSYLGLTMVSWKSFVFSKRGQPYPADINLPSDPTATELDPMMQTRWDRITDFLDVMQRIDGEEEF